jgi:UDP-N-acetylmuramoyl-L-alanyl-D-glutamate--2,6-diaminopimelate ligase
VSGHELFLDVRRPPRFKVPAMLSVETILSLLPKATLIVGSTRDQVSGVEIDSRLVESGSLFCCVAGTQVDGHDYAADALAMGARGLLTERDTGANAALEIRVPLGHARRAAGLLCAAAHDFPSRDLSMVGITGTNGKTTTAYLVSQIAGHLGYHSAMIGTLTGARTTPAAPELQRQLASIRDEARDTGEPGLVAMEVSSHALDQERVAGMVFDVAIFTNLTQDHLDYHGTMAAYFEAKTKLFDHEVSRLAVVWSETQAGQDIIALRRADTIAVNWQTATNLAFDAAGTSFTWRGMNVTTQLVGRTTLIDLLLAIEACACLGMSPDRIAQAIPTLAPAPGRMQVLRGPVGAPTVIVDYAHTPDALEQLLEDLRGTLSSEGRLSLVFGCGGDRDKTKRPIMGAIASSLADEVIVTSDNPRSEDPTRIIAEVVAGAVTDVATMEDRASAIRNAISQAGRHDLVVIAGKGHETTQEIGGTILPFDDVIVARAALTGEVGESPC